MQQVRVDPAHDIRVGKKDLLREVERLVAEGCRLTTMVCLDRGAHFEVIYLLQKPDLGLARLRVRIGKDEELPSISGILLGAALIENEIKEFFGVNLTNIALDFKCHMLLGKDSPKTPLLKREAASN